MSAGGQPALGPRQEYERRRADRAAGVVSLERRYNLISNLRLAVFAVLAWGLWMAWGPPDWPTVWAVAPPAAFLALVVWHEIVARRLQRARRARDYYETALARLDDRWVGVGPKGLEHLDPKHPYAVDLDLFGDGSLFQRLSLARTRLGETTLARWLLTGADPAEIEARQDAVAELSDALDLRETLALEGEELEERGDPRALLRWVERQESVAGRGDQIAIVLLACANLCGLVLWASTPAGPTFFLFSLSASIALRTRIQRRLNTAMAELEEVHAELELLARVLRHFEAVQFRSAWLRRVQSRLSAEGRAPSAWIRRLDRLFDLYEARRNALFAPFSFVLLLDLLVALLLEDWRRRVGKEAPGWLAAVGDLEALSSLAGYAYERPADTFPRIAPVALAGEGALAAPASRAPYFHAIGLGHPLLPASRCVANDVALGKSWEDETPSPASIDQPAPRLLIVSGSNMSGKSTFLRAIGVAVVLGQAGGPVCAGSLRLSPLRLGASIRVVDSIQEGVSHFYAEVRRLRQIVELTHPVHTRAIEPAAGVLFLVDEILQGTNSHDRKIGAQAVLRTLLDGGAVGVVTTHDLALTEMVAALGGLAENVHFEDQLVDGKMEFDYRLRSGVVAKSNALALMRSVGLDV